MRKLLASIVAAGALAGCLALIETRSAAEPIPMPNSPGDANAPKPTPEQTDAETRFNQHDFDGALKRLKDYVAKNPERPARRGALGANVPPGRHVIYQMCIQKTPYCYTPELYQRYEIAFNDYLQNTSLPVIQQKSGIYMLEEVVRCWDDHQLMKKWMHNFFQYLDRFYVKRHAKKPLNEVAVARFRTIIFEKVKQKLTAAILREYEKIGMVRGWIGL